MSVFRLRQQGLLKESIPKENPKNIDENIDNLKQGIQEFIGNNPSDHLKALANQIMKKVGGSELFTDKHIKKDDAY